MLPISKKFKKALAWIGIVATGLAFGSIVNYGFSKNTAVAVIGGSDGPTAIYITASKGGVNWTEVLLLLIAGAIIVLLIRKQGRKSEDN